jgi:hypothetical protein
MPKLLLVVLGLILTCTTAFAQAGLHGKVIASDTRKPVGLANVYLSNTSVGTITNDNGEFVIASFPEGRFDLVVSFIGYETYTIPVQSSKLPTALEITLAPKVTELQEVIVAPYEKNGWEKWGRFFMDNFIGTSANASSCVLLNKDVVKFRQNKKTNTIQAFANETLIIENDALGYRLKYDLTKFEYNFNTRMFYYQGFPFFEDMETKRARRDRKWQERRANAYYGSMMHFMRSLYRNTLLEEHFEVRRLLKISDEEKKRVRAIYQPQLQQTNGGGQTKITLGTSDSKMHPDSANYYRLVLGQSEKLDILINQVLPGDSIAFGIDSLTAGLHFNNYLQVNYSLKKIPAEYSVFSHTPAGMPLSSELTLPQGKTIRVLVNGTFYEGIDLLTLGYWAWSEKVANMLPYEYKPPAKP